MAKEPEFCDWPMIHDYWNLKTGMCIFCHKLHPKALPGLKWAARKREDNVKRGIAKEREYL